MWKNTKKENCATEHFDFLIPDQFCTTQKGEKYKEQAYISLKVLLMSKAHVGLVSTQWIC